MVHSILLWKSDFGISGQKVEGTLRTQHETSARNEFVASHCLLLTLCVGCFGFFCVAEKLYQQFVQCLPVDMLLFCVFMHKLLHSVLLYANMG